MTSETLVGGSTARVIFSGQMTEYSGVNRNWLGWSAGR
jgi:hypothetical protein